MAALDKFRRFQLDLKPDTFKEFECAHEWEVYDENRMGRILVDLEEMHEPVVRTTTVHKKVKGVFAWIHECLIQSIQQQLDHEVSFNNAAAELYEPGYKKMRFHSDQALDLAPSSYICIFSSYSDPNEANPRQLVVRHKLTGETSRLVLRHNSVVVFSTATNRRVRTQDHRIRLQLAMVWSDSSSVKDVCGHRRLFRGHERALRLHRQEDDACHRGAEEGVLPFQSNREPDGRVYIS